MDIKTAIELSGGRPVVAKACGVTNQAIQLWLNNNRLPLTEIIGKTGHAQVISGLAHSRGHEIDPLDLCPGAIQYMQQPKEQAA